MVVDKIGKYELLEDIGTLNQYRSARIKKGAIINIVQIDDVYHKVVIRELAEWKHWNLPVKAI